jgi:hypothetical protein
VSAAGLVDSGADEPWQGPACRRCGCTDFEACAGGCSWVVDPAGLGDLCSACEPAVVAELAAGKVSPARRAALEVLAWGALNDRPVRSTDHTTDLTGVDIVAVGSLAIHQRVAGGLDAEGLAERTDPLGYDYRLTDAGLVLVARLAGAGGGR